MKTIMIYDQCGAAPLTFYVVKGDKSHLHGSYVNSTECTDGIAEEILAIVESSTPYFDFPILEVEPETVVITTGFLN